MEITSFIFNSSKKDLWKLTIKILAFTPLLLLIVLANLYIDPANIYRKKSYEDGMGKLLASGQNVGNFGDCDERLVQKYFIEHLSRPIDTIILGSSRSMQIGKNIFPENVINNSVSGGVLEDYLAIYYNYYMKNTNLKKVVIGIDPWLFNGKGQEVRWQSYEDDVKAMKAKLGEKNHFKFKDLISEKYLNIISLSYFQESILSLFSARKTHDYIATNEIEADYMIKVSDGRLIYDKKRREISTEKAEEAAKVYGSEKVVYGFSDFVEVDPKLKKMLENFIHFMQNKGIKVVIFLSPYHPTTYKMLITRSDTKILLKVSEFLDDLAKRNNVELVGSYNPEDLGLDGGMFFDGMHPKGEAVEKIFRRK
ncbi:hypothetical protein SHI21_10385 [Bacteriovorax sp. PP10]|uniref:Uncharacterized protein n=1 Tax=Bacteriovorax antarcticus TaxID=3088717 RepID=A0ABU5VX69_9BACT|nr:hypothetical protein [Bacteriovorax sp. PP10]MEA9356615.1 hypothetical protein [Bacteriovorax sp. PP10]